MSNLNGKKSEPLFAIVDDIFSVHSKNYIRAITISVKKGILKQGDKVEFVDKKGNVEEVIINSIKIFGKSLTELRTGGMAQIFLDKQYIESIKDKLERGCIFRSIGTAFDLITEFEAEILMDDIDRKFRRYCNPILFDGSRVNSIIGQM